MAKQNWIQLAGNKAFPYTHALPGLKRDADIALHDIGPGLMGLLVTICTRQLLRIYALTGG